MTHPLAWTNIARWERAVADRRRGRTDAGAFHPATREGEDQAHADGAQAELLWREGGVAWPRAPGRRNLLRDQVAADRQRHLGRGGPTPRHHHPVRTNDVRPIGRLPESFPHRDVFVDIERDCGRPDETRRGIHSHLRTPRLIGRMQAWAPAAMSVDIVPKSLNRRVRRTPAPVSERETQRTDDHESKRHSDDTSAHSVQDATAVV